MGVDVLRTWEKVPHISSFNYSLWEVAVRQDQQEGVGDGEMGIIKTHTV